LGNASNDDAEAKVCAECDLEHLYQRLKTGPDGLTSSEAAERLRSSGLNVLPEKEKHRLRGILIQFKNLFNVLLIIAALLSFISGIISNDLGSINMGVVILVVVLISVVFSLFQEYRAEKAVEAIRELIPSNAKVKRDGQMKQVMVSEVVPGDLIILEAGDKVPADARVVNCYELTVDNSSLTGESEAQPRSVMLEGTSVKGDRIACAHLVFAGTTVASGSGTALVVATGDKTEFGRVVTMSQEIVEPLSPLQLELNRTAKMNFIVAIAVGFLFLAIAFFGLHLSLPLSLLFMIGVVISLVPEGFQVTLTVALALSSLAMSKRSVIVKRLSSVETLGSVTVICSDKTGTITEGQMTVRMAWIGGTAFEASGEGYEPEGSISLDGKRVEVADRPDLMRLCEIASLDNTATIVPPLDRRKSRWTAVGDSTEAALLVLAAKAGLQNKEVMAQQPRIGMIPFESGRKMMSSIHRLENGTAIAYVKGAGSEILSRSTHAFWNQKVVPLGADHLKAIKDQIDAFARDAYRVLALAYRDLPTDLSTYTTESIETQLTFVGLVAIYDPPRAESAEAVKQARIAGVRVVMMTGDHELTAEAIARKVGIITTSKDAVMTGYALTEKSDEELDHVLDKPELVFARISPNQKLRVVHRLREKGEKVAVTGDGVNDTPALLEADIGIAMGISGTDVARESADMVLLDDNFASIVHGIEQGRAVFDNLKKFIVYVFAHNWAELFTFIVFVMLGTPLPLTVIMVLAIDLMMEIPPSLGLTIEPPEPGIMDRPPRSSKERLFSVSALARSAYIGIIIGIVATFWCFQTWSLSGWILGSNVVSDNTIYLQGTTITMAAIMAGQLGTLFATRTNIKSTFSVSISKNKWILVGAFTSFALLLALIYLPFINLIIATSPIPSTDFILLYAIAPVIILLEEGRKYFLRIYFIPARPVMALPATAQSSRPLSVFAASLKKVQTPFIEKSGPIAIIVDVSEWLSNEIFIAFGVAKQNGSPLILIRLIDERVQGRMLEELERAVDERSSYLGVPFEYLDIRLSGKDQVPRTIASSIREAIKRTNPDRIILPADRETFRGKRSAIRKVDWVEEFTDKKVMLISNWMATTFGPYPPRMLIPILGEFNDDVFDLAEALTSDANVPDVDVVAAKVIEMPRIVPLYSYYKPESLVNADKELEAIKSLPKWAVIRRIRPMVLLVREAGRDLVQFADERKVDVIALEGDWGARSKGYLGKKEQAIAIQAQCTIVVILPERKTPKP
jgi:P-type Ca2+ transporter type 2C